MSGSASFLGAITGEVKMVTPSGMLSSSVPQRHSFGAGSLMSFPWMKKNQDASGVGI
jgi:hypothetical protein